MLHTTTFIYQLLNFDHYILWYDCLNENNSDLHLVLLVIVAYDEIG